MRALILSLFTVAAFGGTASATGTKAHKEVALGLPYPGMQVGNPAISQGAPGATSAAVGRANERLDDAKILEVLHTFNVAAIEQSELAQQNASDPRVKRLAAEILHSHQEAETRRALFAKRLRPSAMSSSTSRRLDNDAQRTLTDLRNKTGPDFDRAYLAAQIDEHKRDLDMLDSGLTSRASNADVQMLLGELRPLLQHHLNELQALEAELRH